MHHKGALSRLKFMGCADWSEEQGLTYYKVSQRVNWKLQPGGPKPPARVRVPEIMAVLVQ